MGKLLFALAIVVVAVAGCLALLASLYNWPVHHWTHHAFIYSCVATVVLLAGSAISALLLGDD